MNGVSMPIKYWYTTVYTRLDTSPPRKTSRLLQLGMFGTVPRVFLRSLACYKISFGPSPTAPTYLLGLAKLDKDPIDKVDLSGIV